MAYDLEEQEQLDMLKAWWAKYGNLITWVLIVALAGFAGWTYWSKTQGNRAVEAASLYKVLQTAVEAKDNAKIQTAAADIRKGYGATVYAQFARKSYALAEGEIKRTQLQAQKALLERVIAVSNDRAQRLTTDLSIARAQESEVSQRQQQMQVESAALLNEKSVAERKLLMLQRQVQQLQDQSEAGLVQ